MKYLIQLLLLAFPFVLQAQVKVYFNAKIFTGNSKKPYAEAVATNGKYILAVGSNEAVKQKAGSKAEFIDMNGGFLMPGFVDSHNHGIKGGKSLTKANLQDELLNIDQIKSYALNELKTKQGMTGDVLVIYGLNISTWEKLEELSLVFNKGEFKNQPLVLRGSDGHTAWCNQPMLERAKIDKNFIKTLKEDEKHNFTLNKQGEPSGFITEGGFKKIQSALIVETDFSKAAEKTMEYNNQYGITAWLDPAVTSFNHTYQNNLDWYQYLIKNNKLTAHIASTIVVSSKNDPTSEIKKLRALQKQYNTSDFSIIGFKVFADGVIEHPTHTAAISIPYTNTTSKGDLMIDPKQFAKYAAAADKANLLVHVHAIGDRAVTETLNGFEYMRKMNKNLRIPHSITHLQIVQPSDFERFVKLNILASVQLLWAFGDVTTIDMVKPYIDPSLYKWQYPARSMLQKGVTICGASDWSVSTANPFEAIYHAETRKGPLGVLDCTECMPRLAMLYAYTSEAAKALMLEKKIGSLEVGKYADLISVDKDILTVSPESLKETKVLWTMFEGKKVFERR